MEQLVIMLKKLDGHINDEDYLTRKKIWNEFNMKYLVDYHDHYLEKDVLLLADVFEKFTDTCLNFFGLDRCHYFSSPRLSWKMMLKMTGVKLEQIFDIYMKNYYPKKPSKFITYLDINNLNGRVMSGFLLYGRFMWLKNVDNFDVKSISEKSAIVCFLEIDLEYPHELHVLRNNYPLAPEKLAISYDMLSDYCKKIADEYELKVGNVDFFVTQICVTKIIMCFITEIFSCTCL